jgi:hypothetical protein
MVMMPHQAVNHQMTIPNRMTKPMPVGQHAADDSPSEGHQNVTIPQRYGCRRARMVGVVR